VDTIAVKDFIGIGGGRAVGQFDQDLGLHLVGVLAGDHSFHGGEHQHIHVQFQQGFIGDAFRADAAHHRVGIGFVLSDFGNTEAFVTDGPALGIAHRHDFAPKH